jgi:hypothetical protein
MKPISQNHSKKNHNRAEKQPSPLILALLLTGILTLEIYPALIATAAANAGALKNSLAHLESQKRRTIQQFPGVAELKKTSYSEFALNSLTPKLGNFAQGTRQNPPNQLPDAVAAVVRQDLSRQTGIAPGKLKVTESSRQSWPNTCLGLSKADEICGQMIVEGWRVVVSDGRQTWVYRTDARGNVVRLEKKVS